MSKIKIKDILVVICVCYTIISLGTVLFDSIIYNSYQGFLDLFYKFIWTVIGVCTIFTHPLLERLSPLVMIILQYIAALLLVFLSLWIGGFFEELHEAAYYDGFRSFTIIYVIFAIYYYIKVFIDVRKQNRLLREIQAVEKQ